MAMRQHVAQLRQDLQKVGISCQRTSNTIIGMADRTSKRKHLTKNGQDLTNSCETFFLDTLPGNRGQMAAILNNWRRIEYSSFIWLKIENIVLIVRLETWNTKWWKYTWILWPETGHVAVILKICIVQYSSILLNRELSFHSTLRNTEYKMEANPWIS